MAGNVVSLEGTRAMAETSRSELAPQSEGTSYSEAVTARDTTDAEVKGQNQTSLFRLLPFNLWPVPVCISPLGLP